MTLSFTVCTHGILAPSVCPFCPSAAPATFAIAGPITTPTYRDFERGLPARLPPIERWPEYCASKGQGGFCCVRNRCHFICQCNHHLVCPDGHRSLSSSWAETSRPCGQLVDPEARLCTKIAVAECLPR